MKPEGEEEKFVGRGRMICEILRDREIVPDRRAQIFWEERECEVVWSKKNHIAG